MSHLPCGSELNDFCRSLPDDIREQLCARRVLLRGKKKQHLIFGCRQALIVRKGIIVPSFPREDGREKGLTFKYPGLVLGATQLFTNRSVSFSLYVIEDFEACVFPIDFFEQLFMGDIYFAKAVVIQISRALAAYSENTVEFILGNSEDKINSLLRYIDGIGSMKNIILTHEEIATMVGINRVTVTKTMLGKKHCD